MESITNSHGPHFRKILGYQALPSAERFRKKFLDDIEMDHDQQLQVAIHERMNILYLE
jgi:hypothetical protein